MIYAALLRGINVGGRNKVDMPALKRAFEQAGMMQVETYLHTGNVVFTYETVPVDMLTQTLEDAIYHEFGLKLNVLLRTMNDMSGVMDALPENWENDQGMKSDVLFLWEDIDDPSLLDKLVIQPDTDSVIYVPGAVLWSVDRKHAAKSGLVKLAGTARYKQMTIRNVNTARNIYKLMKAVQDT
ncbi:DUF1697 domain-containing protein [Bacillus daqingensis]|uniref:DUF1697 domain-containing protein n=1 Tax=Bacillus daqingensis TaxID=872396 RepID=A0ABV9NRG2_9BACI